MLGPILAQAISPPPDTTVSQWADAHRIISGKAASEPGPWRTSRAPYTKEVMDCFSDPDVEEVDCMWASQLAKTEISLNVIGFFIDTDPCPMADAQPNLDMARYFSRVRVAPMIRATPRLRYKVAEPKSRGSENTVLSKGFPGGQLDIISAESPAGLSARPVRVALADEVDRYDDTAEGDPLGLLEARTANFWNRKIGCFSSPRDKGTSRIEARYEASDKRKWWVPCPACGKRQVLMWSGVNWDKKTDDKGELVYDQNGRVIHLPETARYACEHCGVLWTEAERHEAVAKGEWRAEKPFNGIAGFWLSGLNSPWQSLPRLVKQWLKARGNPGKLRVFINTVLAETWEEQGDSVDDDALLRRAETPGAKLPAEVLVLTASVDVQDDRLEVEVLAWGLGEESWQVDLIVLPGDPGQDDIWQSLDAVLLDVWETEDGRELPLRAVGVDTGGHHTDKAYKFCKPRWRRRVWALKGKSKGLGTPVWPLKFSKRNKGRVPLFSINVDEAKWVVKERLKLEKPGPGFCHFPKTRTQEYFRQFSAEKLVTTYNKKGFKVRVWQAKPGRRNEALDLRAYNYAVLQGLYHLKLDLEREAEKLKRPPPIKTRPQANAAPPSGGVSISQPGGQARGLIVENDDPYL